MFAYLIVKCCPFDEKKGKTLLCRRKTAQLITCVLKLLLNLNAISALNTSTVQPDVDSVDLIGK